MSWQFEDSPLGPVLVATDVPDGRALFYTTRDLAGSLDTEVARRICDFVRDRFGIESSLSTCNQVHGASLVSVPRMAEGWCENADCDALWSASRGVSLGIKVADCLPVTLFDRSRPIVSNIHAGWRGTAQRIVDRAVDVLLSSSPFDPASAVAFLGPSIRQCCFEVGEEVVEQFSAAWPDVERFTTRSGGRPHIDIPALTANALRTRGLTAVFDSGICTRCEGSPFHSWRRDRSGGRNLAIAAQ